MTCARFLLDRSAGTAAAAGRKGGVQRALVGCVIVVLATLAARADQGVGLRPAATNRLDVCGTIGTDTVWTPDTVLVVTCATTIVPGVTLTILPGTIVKIAPYVYDSGDLTVAGTLIAEGMPGQPIVFSSLQDDTYGGDTNGDGPSLGQPGQWSAITFAPGSRGRIAHAVIANGGNYYFFFGGNALVRSFSSDVSLDHVTLRASGLHGLYAEDASVTVTNSTITDNLGLGLRYNGIGATTELRLQGNTLRATGVGAGQIALGNTPHGPVSVRDNVALGGSSGLTVDGTLRNQLQWDNGAQLVLVIDRGLAIAEGGTLQLAPGTIVKSESTVGLEVNGTLLAEGSREHPIVFTSFQDDAFGGDTNGNGPSLGQPNQWSAITLAAGSHARLADTIVTNGGFYYFYFNSNALLRAYSSDVTLHRVILQRSGSYGVYASNAGIRIRHSQVIDNAYAGIHNATPDLPVDARHNWWGDASGPQHPTLNPDGTGNTVSDGVLFTPWLSPFTWLEPTTMFAHDLVALSWAVFEAGAAMLFAEVEAHGPGGTIALGDRLPATGALDWATHPLPQGRYELRARWRNADEATVGEAARAVIVNNDPSLAFHGGRLLASETWEAGSVHVVEEDVFVSSATRLVIAPGAVVKLTPGTRIVVEDGAVLDALALETAPIVITSIRDDSTAGDTNLDGAQSVARPGDWNGIVTRGTGQFHETASVDLRYGQVEHGGVLSGNETWKDAFLHRVRSDVTVPAGATLTIAAGAVVKFEAYKGLVLQPGAHLNAHGTAGRPIVLTSYRDDAAAGDTNGDGGDTLPQAGDWRWIYVDTAEASFDHVEMRYGGGTASGSWDATGVIRTTPGASVDLTNSIVRDGFYECVLAWGGGAVDILNSVISGCDRGVSSDYAAVVRITNSTIDDNRIGLWGHSGRLDVTNSIISNSLEAGIHNALSSPLTLRHSNVWSPHGANYVNMDDQTGSNGNISADPRYKDRTRGNYRLSYGSPAIDAADGIVAPETDLSGAARYDDPRTANTGTPSATGAFADMGAYELVEAAASDVNLVVTSVSGPTQARPGDRVTVEWTITNLGSGVATGPWYDSISLVHSPENAPAVVLADEVLVASGVVLGPGQSHTIRTELTVPASVAGAHYWEVSANVRGSVFEGQQLDDNLARSASPVALDLHELIVDGPAVPGHFDTRGAPQWFKLTATEGQNLRITIDVEAGVEAAEIAAAFEYLPTSTGAGARVSARAPQLSLSARFSGTYYIAATPRRVPASAVPFTIRAETADFRLLSVTPNRAGNRGTATLTVTGVALPEPADVRLIAAGGSSVLLRSQRRVDATRLVATFDLTGVPAGPADVVVSDTAGDERTLTHGLVVLEGGAADFWFEISPPERLRAGRQASVELRWGNRGTTDAPMHLIDLVLPEGVDVALTPKAPPLAERLFLLTAVQDSVEPVVPSGHSAQRTLYITPRLVSEATFDVGAVAIDAAPLAHQAIDWNAIGASSRPQELSEDEWQALWTQLTSQLGDTWADMLRQLGRDASTIRRTSSYTEPIEAAPGDVTMLEALLIETSAAMAALGWDIWSAEPALLAAGAMHPEPNTATVSYGPRQAQPPPGGATYAIVASAQNYRDAGNPGLGDLPRTLDNHTRVVDYLTKVTQVPRGNITELQYLSSNTQADWEKFTRDNFTRNIEALKQNAKAGDTIFVYLTGHGDKGFLWAPDGKKIRYQQDLYEPLDASKASKIVVSVDACYAGSFTDWLKQQSGVDGKKWNVLVACESNDTADGLKSDGNTFTSEFFGTRGNFSAGGSWYDAYVSEGAIYTIPLAFWESSAQRPQWFGEPDSSPTLTDKLGGLKHAVVDGIDKDCKRPKRRIVETAGSARAPTADCPPGATRQTVRIPVAGSADPNEKLTVGLGERGHTPAETPITYTVYFENDPQQGANAPVQELLIVDQLSAALDWASLELATIGLGDERISVPPGRDAFTTATSVPDDDHPVVIEAALNRDTGIVTWHLASRDPATRQLPEDPLAGFLPVNDATGRGQGFVSFAVKPLPGLPNGTQIHNRATITFDPTYGVNPPIVTNETLNTIGTPPAACAGDCSGDGEVTIEELIQGVNIALETFPVDACASFDTNGDAAVTIDELIVGVTHALTSCPVSAPTATPVTPAPTEIPSPRHTTPPSPTLTLPPASTATGSPTPSATASPSTTIPPTPNLTSSPTTTVTPTRSRTPSVTSSTTASATPSVPTTPTTIVRTATPTIPTGAEIYCATLAAPLAIPDNDEIGVGHSLAIADDREIAKLRVHARTEHTWVGDLVLTLVHVETLSIAVLTHRPGNPPGDCDSNDLDCIFDDSSERNADDQCAVTPPAVGGAVAPTDPLSVFDGESRRGEWMLFVSDMAPGDTGRLAHWCLEVR